MFNSGPLFTLCGLLISAMESVERFVLELVSACRRELFGKKKSRYATKKRQRKWLEIHLSLVDNGYISPQKFWSSTRAIWYRMVSAAKTSLRKYEAGLLDDLHHQDRSVLQILGIPIIAPTLNIAEKENTVLEEGPCMRIESNEVIQDYNESAALNISQMSDLELKRGLLMQEFRLNEYKLLKMKFFFIKSGNVQIYQQFLKQLEM